METDKAEAAPLAIMFTVNLARVKPAAHVKSSAALQCFKQTGPHSYPGRWEPGPLVVLMLPCC